VLHLGEEGSDVNSLGWLKEVGGWGGQLLPLGSFG